MNWAIIVIEALVDTMSHRRKYLCRVILLKEVRFFLKLSYCISEKSSNFVLS